MVYMEEQINLGDLARKAGVSTATVSLALNNRRGVSKATREKILLLAGELGYRKRASNPNYKATVQFLQIIRHGHTLNRDHNVFIADYIEGITREAKELQVKVEISSYQAFGSMQEIIRTMRQQEVAGFIILGTELSAEDVRQFINFDKPLVFLDTYIDFQPFDFVDMNNADAVYRVVSHFVETGHRSVGLVSSPVMTRNFHLRATSFREVLRQFDLPQDEKFFYEVDSTFQGAYQDFLRHLSQGASVPEGLFCVNDIVCFGVMKALKEAGYRIPEDISVIGFDDLPTSALSDPPLTSVQVSKKEIGAMALSLLRDRIVKEVIPPVKVQISGDLIIRESVRDRTLKASS